MLKLARCFDQIRRIEAQQGVVSDKKFVWLDPDSEWGNDKNVIYIRWARHSQEAKR